MSRLNEVLDRVQYRGVDSSNSYLRDSKAFFETAIHIKEVLNF
jgi:hypothetical protein